MRDALHVNAAVQPPRTEMHPLSKCGPRPPQPTSGRAGDQARFGNRVDVLEARVGLSTFSESHATLGALYQAFGESDLARKGADALSPYPFLELGLVPYWQVRSFSLCCNEFYSASLPSSISVVFLVASPVPVV